MNTVIEHQITPTADIRWDTAAGASGLRNSMATALGVVEERQQSWTLDDIPWHAIQPEVPRVHDGILF